MKKVISIVLCVAMICLCFTGCGGPNADLTEENVTDTVNLVVDALQSFDSKKLEKYVDSATLEIIMSYAKDHDQFADLGKAIFKSLEIEIVDIDLDASTVKVSVMNKDLYDVADDFASNLKDNYSGIQLLSKLSNESFLDRSLNTLCSGIDAAQMKSEPDVVTLSIEQAKGNLVLVFDESAEDAVSGGALIAVKQIFTAGSVSLFGKK